MRTSKDRAERRQKIVNGAVSPAAHRARELLCEIKLREIESGETKRGVMVVTSVATSTLDRQRSIQNPRERRFGARSRALPTLTDRAARR